MGKLPAFLMYPKDWLTDAQLCICSKAAKGVWADMLCLMFVAPNRGVLAMADGEPWSDQTIAEAIGGNTATNLEFLAELLTKGVAHRDRRGAIFSRRMVRDEEERKSNNRRQKRHRRNNDKSNEFVTKEITSLSVTANATGNEIETEIKRSSLSKEDVTEILDEQQSASFVCLELGISGAHGRMKVLDSVKSCMHLNKFGAKEAAEKLVALCLEYEACVTEFRKGRLKFFEEGEWTKPESWRKKSDKWAAFAKGAK